MNKISLCTVSIESIEHYLEIMVKSALEKLPLLHEIIICDVDAKYYKSEQQEKVGNITIRRINLPIYYEFTNLLNFNISSYVQSCPYLINHKRLAIFQNSANENIIFNFGHSLGLHHCINSSESEYLLFSDPDIIFYNNVDEIYLGLMDKYNLQYVGCANEAANKVAYGFFPYLANSLVKKTNLPNSDFLSSHLYGHGHMRGPLYPSYKNYPILTGKYLIRGLIPEFVEKFNIPQDKLPDVDFDTGSNLYLWALEKNWKWLSFLTNDCQNYKTTFYRSNIKIPDLLKIQKLIYHQWGRFRNESDSFDKFKKIYEDSIQKN